VFTKTSIGITAFLVSFASGIMSADDAVEVTLKVPMLVCHELAGGVRPPAKEGAEPEHDLIFFVLSGLAPDGSAINQLAPNTGAHLKIDNQRQSMIVKNVELWKGKLREGETVTLVISVREQDGRDTAEKDVEEAAQIAKHVTRNSKLAELSRINVPEILRGEHGENDHVGTIVVRFKLHQGELALQTEPGDHARYLKGYPANHPTERSFKLSGDHSDYDLHLRVED
jgi:hypothetical protein